MREENGRFLRKAPSSDVEITPDGFFVGSVSVVQKVDGRFMPRAELFGSKPLESVFRGRLEKIARLLDEGKQAEAMFLASTVNWVGLEKTVHPACFSKANFDSSEPRDDRGRWISDSEQPEPRLHIVPVASANDPRGNKMVRDAANAAGLNRAQRRMLHDSIAGQGISDYQTILQIVKDIASGGV